MGYNRIDQEIKKKGIRFGITPTIVFVLCILFSYSNLYAETLIPLKVQKGTNLIEITRKFCTSEYHWKEIAKINNLKPPYIISPGEVLFAPIELLKVEKLSAKVASVIGGVFIVRNGKKLNQVSKGDLIYPGQTLVTENDGFTHLVFPDNKYTRISSGSKFTLTYLVKLSDSSLKAEFFLEKGRITHEVKKQLEVNETFTTRTPVSVTGVRGTEFRLKLSEGNINIVETLKGVVSVKGDTGVLALKKGEGTKIAKGSSPEPPKLLPKVPVTPAVKDIFKVLPVKIDTPAEGDVSQYRLRVTTDEKGDNTVLEKLAEPSSSFTLLALPDGLYWGFLTAIDAEGFESLPANPFSFELRTIPGAPIFISPQDGNVTFETTVESKWLQAEGAENYHLQLAKDQEFESIEIDLNQKGISYVFNDLAPGTYHLRVQAIAPDGFQSLYSLVDTWKVQKQATLGALEGSNEAGLNLRWASMGEDIVYDIQIGKNKKFTKLLVSENGLKKSEFVYAEYMEPATYYVRVRGVLGDGQVSPWTPPQKLTIDAAPFGFWDAGLLAIFLGIILI
jgi:hypothetical protein